MQAGSIQDRLKRVFSFFTRDPKRNEDRFIHMDGSSAYASGFQRLTQRTDFRVGVAVSSLYAILATAYQAPDLIESALLFLKKVGPLSSGVLLSLYFNTEVTRTVDWLSRKLGEHESISDNLSIYDLIGKTRSKHHEAEVADARDSLRMEKILTAVSGVPAIVTLCVSAQLELSAQNPALLSTLAHNVTLGFLACYIPYRFNRHFRVWQIANEKITLADIDQLPPQQESKKDIKIGDVATASGSVTRYDEDGTRRAARVLLPV